VAEAARPGSPGSVEILAREPGRFEVQGALTFATARRASEAGIRQFSQAQPHELEVSCAGVTAADSAALAVLLVWLAWARATGRSLRLTSLPAAVTGIARISEVETILELGVGAGRAAATATKR
jgi:phospholipid transport system transporter-binding protein